MRSKEFKRHVGVLIGEASMLFGLDGKEPFNSTRAIEIVDEILKPYEILETKVDYYEAPEHIKFAVRSYAELSSEDRIKIDNLMKALTDINPQPAQEHK